jgi:hypothetical protein
MLSVMFCCYAECRHTESHYVERHYSD